MSLNPYRAPTVSARWAILIGLCSIAAGMLSYFQVQRHSFVSTSNFGFVVLERIALGALLFGLLTTILGAALWARRASPREVAFCGFAVLILVTVAQQFSSPNFYAWTGALVLVGAAGRLIGLLCLVFAAVRSLRHRRTKSELEAAFERLQAIDWALLLAVPLYLLVPTDTQLAQTLSKFPITAVSAGIAIAVFILVLSMRSKILRPASAALLLRPNDAVMLKNWRAGQSLSLVLSHSIAVYGLVVQMAGHPRYGSLPFYVAACLLLLVWMPHAPKSFHEKAGASQDGFVFTGKGSLPLSQAASVAILPSALLLSDFRSVPVGRSRCSRCCYLIIDLGSHRFDEELGQDLGAVT